MSNKQLKFRENAPILRIIERFKVPWDIQTVAAADAALRKEFGDKIEVAFNEYMTYLVVDYYLDDAHYLNQHLVEISRKIQQLLLFTDCSSAVIFNGMPSKKFKLNSYPTVSLFINDEQTSISKLNERIESCRILTITNAERITGGILSILKIDDIISFSVDTSKAPWVDIINQHNSKSIAKAQTALFKAGFGKLATL